MWFQYLATVVTVAAIITFAITCFLPSPSEHAGWHIPVTVGDPSVAIATCFLSYAITFIVPSWWNDHEPDCPAPLAIKTAVSYTTLCYYIPMAFLPAFAFTLPSGQDSLDLFLDSNSVNLVAVVAAYSLTILGIMPNVIAYSVSMRDNLQALGPFFTFRVSSFIASAAPVAVGWILDSSTGFGFAFNAALNWSAIGVLACINFLIPLTLVLKLASDDLGHRTALVQADAKDSFALSELALSEVIQASMLIGMVCLLIAIGCISQISTMTPHEPWDPWFNGVMPFPSGVNHTWNMTLLETVVV